MQTFLPYPDFHKTAEVLDYRRLGKQRIEGKQLLDNLLGRSKGWHRHPAARMWEGHAGCLAIYTLIMCREWSNRGYEDNQAPILVEKYLPLVGPDYSAPVWMGDSAFHASHRAALLHKDFEYYSQFNWAEKPELNYIWPVEKQ